ncbi:MAG: ROK family protein [Oscillospiraceae bacterium]|nr:ROK family protein [Oscillospiraceae bacterium]
MGVSLATVSREVAELIRQDAIEDVNGCLRVCADFGYFLGLQISAGIVRVTLLNFKLKPVDAEELRKILRDNQLDEDILRELWDFDPIKNCYEDRSKERDNQKKPFIFYETATENNEHIDYIINALRFIVDKIQPLFAVIPLLAVGLATPGLTDEGRVIRFCPNVQPLVNQSIHGLLNATRLMVENILVTYCHDTAADMMWIKESLYGPEFNGEANEGNVSIIHIGSGVGSSFVFNRMLYYGKNNCAGEIGHFLAPRIKDELVEKKHKEDGGKAQLTKKCDCKENCIESEIQREIFDGKVPSVFFKTEIDTQEGKDEDKLKNYFNSKEHRLALFKEYIRILGQAIINYTNVGLLVFSGRLAPVIEDYINDKTLRFESVQNIASNVCTVRASKGWVETAARGAACAAYHKCLETSEPVRVSWKELKKID